jgi:RNase H-like domain found in reverse transcriptase/Reverse transcriptase (RNA-dependent DNA polymerase)/Integrase zinc binding domain/Integrase core domain
LDSTQKFQNFPKSTRYVKSNPKNVFYNSNYKQFPQEEIIRLNQKIIAEIETLISRYLEDNRPFAHVEIFGTTMKGLLDSGSNVSVLGKNSLNFINKFKLKPTKVSNSIHTVDGTTHRIEGRIDLPFRFGSHKETITTYIIPTLARELVLGMDFWDAFGIRPILCEEVSLPESKYEDKTIDLSSDQKKQLTAAINTLPKSSETELNTTNRIEHHIDTGDSQPITQRPYLVSPAVQEKIYSELDRLLKLGIIEESQSDWSNPLVVVKKANGSTRLCIDARKLNEITIKDEYPLPNINRILAQLRSSKYLSSIDLKDAFFQIPLSQESRHKTAFAVPGHGFYQFARCPFGLSNSPKTMCRLMDRVLGCSMEPFVFTYLDDIIIATSDFDTHIKCILSISERFREAGLSINVGKSKFCQQMLEYLGYVIDSNSGLRMNPEKIAPILNYPTPTKVKEVQRFLGVVGWYQRFIKNYAGITAPISKLTSKEYKKKFSWTPEAENAFQKLKSVLVSSDVLSFPDYNLPFQVHTDASDIAVGAVLTQIQDGVERPIAFFSKKLNSAQRNYSTTERECLGVVLAVEKFRPYVEGSRFEIITDHSSLRQMRAFKNQKSRLFRFSMRLQGYDFSVTHRKGVDNIVPDALSRAIEEIELTNNSFKTDKWYQELRNRIFNDPEQMPKYHADEQYVYRVLPNNQRALVLPVALREVVLRENHDNPKSGHQGVFKTTKRLKAKYYWPTMLKDVKKYVSSCQKCKASKSVHQRMRPPMGSQKSASQPWEVISIDLIGPLTRSKSGNTVILSIVDVFTKFALIFPLKKAEAKPIIKILENFVFLTFNVPRVLISDNGKQFISNDFKNFLNEYHVVHHKTAYYHPQANPVERVNKVIGETVRCYVGRQHDVWDENLAHIGAAIRTSVHFSTGHTPYFLNFGREMILDGRTYEVKELLGNENRNSELEKLSQIRDQAKENIKKAFDKYSSNYNLRSKVREFHPGDRVWRKNYCLSDASKKISAKLAPKYISCIIKKRMGNVYEIEDEKGKYKGIFHAKDLLTDEQNEENSERN